MASLASGTRVGPYVIEDLIGAGGMGEVYRARDERLGRNVALKLLPPRFAADPTRLRRFEQEARAVGALDHPNVLAVHDVGHHDDSPYIVTELLEGETLRSRLKRGPLPAGKAVDLARQVVAGLAAAHARGVVHRDLKPDNLFITRSGHVKILDFGLAKLREDEVLSAVDPGPDRATADATTAGTLLGTVGYLAPEQSEGKDLDARADIFSFGCVLYEMLAGTRAFSGSDPRDVLAAVRARDPRELADLAPQTPPALARLVDRCLEKNRDERFSSAHDLGLAIDTLSDPGQPSLVSRSPRRPRGHAAAPDRRSRPRREPGVVSRRQHTGVRL